MEFYFNYGEIKTRIYTKKYESRYVDVFVKADNIKELCLYVSNFKSIEYSLECIRKVNKFDEIRLHRISKSANVYYVSLPWQTDDITFYLKYIECSENENKSTDIEEINNLGFYESAIPWNESAYYIIVDRYCDIKEKEKLDDEDYYAGGTFSNIYDDLGRIRNAGYSIVYLSPIMESLGYHGYNQLALFDINAKIGGEKELLRLVSEIKNAGMKLGLELVLNHISVFSEEFKKAIRHESEMITIDANADYVKYRDNTDLVKIEYTLKNKEEILKKITELINKYNVGFIRLDSCDYINDFFVNSLMEYCINSKIIVIGECWNNYGNFFNNYKVNGATNYKLFGLVKQLYVDKNVSVSEFEKQLVLMIYEYGLLKNNYMLNFIDNHDVSRVSNYVNSIKELLNMISFIYIYIGIPMVYYGTENYSDNIIEISANRRGFSLDINKQIELCINKLNKLRKEFVDDIVSFETEKDILCIERKIKSGNIKYIYNNSNLNVNFMGEWISEYESIIIKNGERIDFNG